MVNKLAMINLPGTHDLIARRFIFLTVMLSSCLALLFTIVQVKFEYERELTKHQMYQQLISESLLGSLSKSIWTYDDAQIYLQLQGIVKIPTIEKVMLSLPDNVVFSVGKIQSKKTLIDEIDVVYSPARNKTRRLGLLTIHSGMDQTYYHLIKFAGGILLSNATKAGLVILFMLYLLDRLIGRHLYAITRYLSLYQEGKKPPTLTLNRKNHIKNDELELLVSSLNNMHQRIYFEQRRALAEAKKREQLQIQLMEQKELLHAVERHAGLGEMAATLAHELKQPVASLVGYTQMSQQLLVESEPDINRLRTTINKLQDNANLAQGIIVRTAKLLKNVKPTLETIEINDLINHVITLLGHNLIDADIMVSHRHKEQKVYAQMDEIQFEQVLLNIIRNAIDALASLEQDLKVIEISVVQDDQCIMVKIEDNGDGISKEISSQLFKPFFTTKDNGMGIGLSTSLSLIEAMEGTILARNRLERGACFTITLPVLDKVMA